MKRRHSSSPLRGSHRALKTRATVGPEAIGHNGAMSLSPPCLRQTCVDPSSTLPFPSVGALTSVLNQDSALDDAAARKNLRSPAASARGRRNSVQYRCTEVEPVVTLDQGRRGEPTHAGGLADVLEKVERGKLICTEEKPLCCGHEAPFLAETDERWASSCVPETDVREWSVCEGESQWLTQQQAVEEFCLPPQTLKEVANEGLVKAFPVHGFCARLQMEKRPNPYGATYAPMRLYQRCQLRQLAFQMWGGEAGVERERERRREQRWQQRQQRMTRVLCDSGTLEAGIMSRARSGKSLPELRTFLRKSSKRRRGGAPRTLGTSLRRTSVALSASGAATDAQSFTAPDCPIAACSCREKEDGRQTEAKCLHAPASAREQTHSTCEQDVWEEI